MAEKTAAEWEAEDHARRLQAVTSDPEHRVLADAALFNLRHIGDIRTDIRRLPDELISRMKATGCNGFTYQGPLGKISATGAVAVKAVVAGLVILLALRGFGLIRLPQIGQAEAAQTGQLSPDLVRDIKALVKANAPLPTPESIP